MTNFLTNVALGSAAPMVSKDKGDISNRTKCFGAQFMNSLKTLAADTVVIGGAAATGFGATKFSKAGQFWAGLTEKFINCCKKSKLISKTGILENLKDLSKTGKIMLPIAALTGAVLAYINLRDIYRAGQIDQKYTDKAKLEKSTKEVI